MVDEIPGKEDDRRSTGSEWRSSSTASRITRSCCSTRKGRVLSWNDGATLLFGYHAAEVIGQPFSRFFIPEDVETGPVRGGESARPPRAAR